CSTVEIVKKRAVLWNSSRRRRRELFHHLLGILYEGDQSTHFLATLPWIHQVRENVAVEGVDTAGRCPGVEGEIIGLAGSHRDRILLDRLCQHMPIFSDDVEEVTM